MIRSSPLDAVVLVGGCDKTVPAQLMGAASAGVPAIALGGGPMQPGNFRGRRIGAGTDIWRYTDDLRAGRMSAGEYAELEAATRPGVGHCSEMGTASTMATLTEALGMSLPGSAAVPATDARRGALAEETGRRAVGIAREGLRPAGILTAEALENAVTVLAAVAGSHETPCCTCWPWPGGWGSTSRWSVSTRSPPARRCSPTSSPPASTCSRTCSGRAACRRCSASWRRCCTSTPPR